MASVWSVSYSTWKKERFETGLTETQAAALVRGIVRNFYSRETGCYNPLIHAFGDMIVSRNGSMVLEYRASNKEFYVRRAGKKEVFGVVPDWENIFTTAPSKMYEKALLM